MNYYYLDQQNQTKGPISLGDLEALVQSGRLNPDPLVIREGGSEWVRLSARPRSAPAPAPPPPPGVSLPPAPSARPASAGPSPVEVLVAAGLDAVKAAKAFAVDPVGGGLQNALNGTRPDRTIWVGLIFGTTVAGCILFLFHRLAGAFFGGSFGGAAILLKSIAAALSPFASLFACLAGTRKFYRAEGAWASDCFIAGACLLPIGLAALAGAVLGLTNIEVSSALAFFAFCLLILALFSALTRVYKIKESVGGYLTPVLVLASAYISKVIFGMILG